MSNPIRRHKGPSIKSQGMLRVTGSRTYLQAEIPHLPKITTAVTRGNDVKETQVPISRIADYFTERKKTLKLNGFHWQGQKVPMPNSLPLVIRGYKSGNCDNMTYKERPIGNRKERTSFLESSTTRENLQNSADGSASTSSDNTGLGDDIDGISSSLRYCNGPLTTKFQKAKTKVAARFQGGHGYVMDGDIISVKGVKSANVANSSADCVARKKWTKAFVKKTVNRQQKPSASSIAEKRNTRTELEQGCSLSCSNEITLDLELEHRSVSQAADCSEHPGSGQLCLDDNCAKNVENLTGERGADLDHAAKVSSQTTFQSLDVHNILAGIPKGVKPEGRVNKIVKQPDQKCPRIKSSSSIGTSISKVSVKSLSTKASKTPACSSVLNKCSDNESKASSSVSEDSRIEEYMFELNQMSQERVTSTSATVGVPMVKCGARCHNQRLPLKSSLKKSFDWRAHSQSMATHVPKIGEQCKDAGANQALAKNKLVPIHQSLNQTAQNYTYSIPEEESPEFCEKLSDVEKQCRKLRQLCHQSSHHRLQNVCNLGLRTTIQQKLVQLHYCGTADQQLARNMKIAANTNMSSHQFYWRENHAFQPENEPQHMQFPQPHDLIWCKNPSTQRTVELFTSHGGEVPKITMTCPTPISCRTPS
ncbi:uncharacterized protein LOC129706481 [Leucoraja erinacea]|uniref:uncharacterized protein LOC129706481 n=1 Tax=Leucoraja erinaceus TaxID=7782 RepID=UPI0024570905|nr:uncharacterized protein LOC129706481 [Leucoraja erinacea]XP_055506791.1 uncharacterized protein LOC129706481 [Leucoraja erinacea]